MTANHPMPEPGPNELLAIYLRDHRAGATAGIALARRCLRNNRADPLGIYLAGLVTEIRQDIDSLEDVMRRLEVSPNPLKMAFARVTEEAGRLKLNGQLVGYSPLSRVIEIEALIAGVTAKRRLWHALSQVADDYPELAGVDFTALLDRAEDQISHLEQHHDDASNLAFHSVTEAPG